MASKGSWSRADGAAFEAWLGKIGIEHEELDTEKTSALRTRWRKTYAAPLFDDTGTSLRVDFDFETFSGGTWPSVRGEAALSAYGSQREVRYFVLPDPRIEGMPAYRCSSLLLPTFHGDDLIVSALDLSWTMAFTHGDGADRGGPFFARADALDA
ncbi:MAG: hypothetical protein H5U40_10110 [Polyangiaceae bacterium]|nr:hypothetical protein [Polyangiaceae bacterium]